MAQHTITLGFVLLGLGLLALLIGLRGKRIDREPRCPSRRCKYALGSVIESRRASEGETFPLTCPECGRVIAHEREFRVGTRRRIKTALALALVLLLPALGLLGFEGYAAWRSTSAVNTMPLWLLMRQAERDSTANRFVHQRELLERVKNSTIPPKRIPDVVERILDWQADPRVAMVSLPDAIPELALQGHVTLAQMQRFWDQYYHFTLVLPPTVEPGEPLPFTVRAEARVGYRGGPIPETNPWGHNAMYGAFFLGSQIELTVQRITVNGTDWHPHAESSRILSNSRDFETYGNHNFSWRAVSDAWDSFVAPHGQPGESVEFTIEARWDWTGSGQNGVLPDPKTNQWVDPQAWLNNRGITVGGEFTLRGMTRLAQPGSVRVERVSNDQVVQNRLVEQMNLARIAIVVQPQGDIQGYINADAAEFPMLQNPPPIVFADLELRRGEWAYPLRPVEVDPRREYVSNGVFPNLDMQKVVARAALLDPEGWSLALIPRPERALLAAERPRAWAGDPIVVPLRVEVDWRCWDPPPDPKLPD
jgi:hypothetical protein